jgi:O-antigen ligase
VAFQQSRESLMSVRLRSPGESLASEKTPVAPRGLRQVQQSSEAARVASWLLFATVAVAPLPFGSNIPTAIAFWCIVLGAALVFAPVRGLSVGQFALVGSGVVVVAAYALVLHEQLAEHPWLPGAAPHPIWRQAQEALNVPLVPVVSIARNQPWFELGRPLVCILAGGCGFLVGADEGRVRQLMKVIAWSGATYAAYGILAHLFDPSHVLWLDKQAYLDSVTSTFINRNTAGAYFGSCAVVWSLLLWEAVRWQMPRGSIDWRAVPSRILSASSKSLIVKFCMFFVCLLALFMSGSRAAVVISLLALILTFIIFFRRHLPRRSGIAAALVGGSAVALLLLQLMGAGVNARFDAQGLADEGRLSVYESALRMIADHPWLGTGQGTFAYAFPAYRDTRVSIWGVWDMAHNSLLQIATDMGVPIAGLVVIAWGVVFAVLIHGMRVRRRGLLFPVTAFGVATIGVLHSFVDFSLQTPGYAIVVMSLIGAGLAQSFARQGNHAAPEARPLGEVARKSFSIPAFF